MEFIDGTPLRGPLLLPLVIRYALQICDGLEEVHKKRITHRDLKPGNILVTTSGVKLLDFGVVASSHPDDITQTTPLTQAGTVIGTAAYRSSEQAKGQHVDSRSDIFSFGALLYELVTGRRAFAGNSPLEAITAILRDEPLPLDAPSDISATIARCLRKSPAERYQTIGEVREALGRASCGAVTKAPSIVVLPFANLSADKEQECFSDGLAEEIINLLANVPNLKVNARTSSFYFDSSEKSWVDSGSGSLPRE